jgi:hypothetical protein
MYRRSWTCLLLVLPGLPGCAPPGANVYYRSALAARSEFVDTLSRIVDEQSAKDKFKNAEKLLTDRLNWCKDGIDGVKFESIQNKMKREAFDPNKIDLDDKNMFNEGLKAYYEYCKNIGATNIRFNREKQRLKMVANLEVLKLAESQLQNKQPVTSTLGEFRGLSEMWEKLENMNKVNLKYLMGVSKERLAQLKPALTDDQLAAIVDFDPGDGAAKFKGEAENILPPALPPYPEWALTVDRNAKLGLTKK